MANQIYPIGSGGVTIKELVATIGQPNGLASLSVTGKIDSSQLQTNITVGTEPPSNPNIGDLWIDTN